jgi:hypothetical protein
LKPLKLHRAGIEPASEFRRFSSLLGYFVAKSVAAEFLERKFHPSWRCILMIVSRKGATDFEIVDFCAARDSSAVINLGHGGAGDLEEWRHA